MSTITIIAATTGAVATKRPIDARGYDRILLTAHGLAGAEEVDIVKGGGADWAPFTMPDGTTPAKLTATNASIELPAALYGVTKDATAGATSVTADLIPR